MKPMIQIDDEVREMTDDEYNVYLLDAQNKIHIGVTNKNETPTEGGQ